MKIPKFKFIAQRTDDDCAIAALAMVTGRSYNKVSQDFYRSGKIPNNDSIQYLTDCGLCVVVKDLETWCDQYKSNKRMLQPFAERHFITAKTYTDEKFNHAFVMDKYGRCFDPSGMNRPLFDPARKFYLVQRVIGVWYT